MWSTITLWTLIIRPGRLGVLEFEIAIKGIHDKNNVA